MDTQGEKNRGYPANAKRKSKKKTWKGQIKRQSQTNQHPKQPEKQCSPQTGPDSAAAMGFECCWSHCHAVCDLLTWETHEPTETLHERNFAGEV